MVYDKAVFIKQIKYISKRGLVDLYDHQTHLSEEDSSQPVSSICKRLREAQTIQKELTEGRAYDELATQRGVSVPHLKKVIKLLHLPSEKRRLIEQDDPSIQQLGFKEALMEVHKHEQWLSIVRALDHADLWREQDSAKTYCLYIPTVTSKNKYKKRDYNDITYELIRISRIKKLVN